MVAHGKGRAPYLGDSNMFDKNDLHYKKKASQHYGRSENFKPPRIAYRVTLAFGVFALIVALVLYASAVRADCVSTDVQGSWQAFQHSGFGGWQECGLVIGDNGRVVPNLTRCIDSNGVRSTVTGGVVTVLATCRVQGTVTNDFGTFFISMAWMELDTNTITAVGKDDAQLPYIVQIVRRPQ